MYMCAKYRFAPSADFVAQSVDLGFAQISADSAVEPRMVLGTISYRIKSVALAAQNTTLVRESMYTLSPYTGLPTANDTE